MNTPNTIAGAIDRIAKAETSGFFKGDVSAMYANREKLRATCAEFNGYCAKLASPLRVLAHTAVQLDVFRQKAGIHRDAVRQVRSLHDIVCVGTQDPLILLPAWFKTKNADEIVRYWRDRGGRVVEVYEDQVLGVAPLCSNDTDGDGDCHLCAKLGGCRWPHTP